MKRPSSTAVLLAALSFGQALCVYYTTVENNRAAVDRQRIEHKADRATTQALTADAKADDSFAYTAELHRKTGLPPSTLWTKEP